MADKSPTLSIVLKTVDNATAGIRAVNAKLETLTTPLKGMNKAWGDLREHLSVIGNATGLPRIVDGFKGVGSAVSGLLGKIAVVGGVAALAVHGVLALVEEFDNLGDTAEKLSVSVDFLASMRFAAERSGASVEDFNQGITSLGENMGQLRAGTGRMLKFLMQVSPALVDQLKHTKGNEEAFLLLADAMSKITDPQKRLALAAKLGLGSVLVPMLARGKKGLVELQDEFKTTAGSLEDAAKAAGESDDALKNLGAATTGVKAALITGLAPALTEVVKQMTAWLSGHREDVRRWAEDIGKKLPGAVDQIVTSVKKAVTWVTEFVGDIGGWKTAAVAVAAVIAGPLISAVVALGVAMASTPIGAFLLGATELLLLAKTIKDAGGPRSSKSFDLEAGALKAGIIPGGIGAAPAGAQARLMASGALPKSNRFRIEQGRLGAIAREADANIAATRAADVERQQTQQAHIKIDIAGAPPGTRATADPRSSANVDMTVGYNLLWGGS